MQADPKASSQGHAGRGHSPAFEVERLHVTSVHSDNAKLPREATPSPTSSVSKGRVSTRAQKTSIFLFQCFSPFFPKLTSFLLVHQSDSALVLLTTFWVFSASSRLDSRSGDGSLFIIFLRDRIPSHRVDEL